MNVKPTRSRRAAYRVVAGRDGVRLELHEDFWNNAIVDDKGTTQLDHNIAQVLQEIRAALYFLGTEGTKH